MNRGGERGVVKQGWWWPRMRSEEVFKPGDPPDPGQLSLIKPHLPSFVKGTLATVGLGTQTKKDPSGQRCKKRLAWLAC